MINNILQTSELRARTASAMALEHAAKTIETASSGPSDENVQSLQDALAQLAAILNDVQTETAKTHVESNEMNKKIADLLIKGMQSQIDEVNRQIEAQKEAEANRSWWDKLINGITAALGCVIAVVGIVTCNPALVITGAVMATTAILNLTGGMQAITSAIANVLTKMGVDPKVADLIAQLIIFVVVIASTYGCGVGASSTVLAKLAQAGYALGTALMSAPRLFSDIAAISIQLTNPNMSAADKAKAEMEAALIQAIVGAVFAIVGGGISNFNNISGALNNFSKFFSKEGLGLQEITALAAPTETYAAQAMNAISESKMFTNINSFTSKMTSSWMKNLYKDMQATAQKYQTIADTVDAANGMFGGVAGIASGTNETIAAVITAKTQAPLATAKAECALLATELKINDDFSKNANDHFASKLKDQAAMMADVIKAIETEFVNSMPA
jgi:hypothetical protein